MITLFVLLVLVLLGLIHVMFYGFIFLDLFIAWAILYGLYKLWNWIFK